MIKRKTKTVSLEFHAKVENKKHFYNISGIVFAIFQFCSFQIARISKNQLMSECLQDLHLATIS